MESRQAPTPIHETSESVWDTTMAVNVKSVFLGSKYAIRQMLQQEPHNSGHRGWIINIASIYGLVAGKANRMIPRLPLSMSRKANMIYADEL